MIQAILYTSNAGTTEQYAKLLSARTGLPAYPLTQHTAVPKGAEILYLGWVMASTVKGYKKAAESYNVRALCGVCMGATGSQIAEVRKANHVPEELPVFTMQGGFDLKKLSGTYKMMMNVMAKTAGKKLAEKTDRTPDEDQMLDMMLHGGNYVSEENLSALLTWYAQNQ
jgi:hypothetical protein